MDRFARADIARMDPESALRELQDYERRNARRLPVWDDAALNERQVRKLVGDLAHQLMNTSPSETDVLVGMGWACALVEAVFGPQDWPTDE